MISGIGSVLKIFELFHFIKCLDLFYIIHVIMTLDVFDKEGCRDLLHTDMVTLQDGT